MIERRKEALWDRIPFWLKQFFVGLSTLGGAIVLIYGAIAFVDDRIEEAINEPAYAERLARHIRPSAIFDERGSILADMGAKEFISELSVDTIEVSYGVPSLSVRLTPTQHLPTQPVIEPLDGRFVVNGGRGEMYDWVFTIEPFFSVTFGGNPTVENYRFRLEIVR